MKSTAFFKDIDADPASVYVMHERDEMDLPPHAHVKGQLSYVEGGIVRVHSERRSLILPARHYIWIPAGMRHVIEMRGSTVIRTLYFYAHDDHSHAFYNQPGIYPINTLLLQMLTFSERWQGNVMPAHHGFHFLAGIKSILPDTSQKSLPIILPTTDHARMQAVLRYLDDNLFEHLELDTVAHATGYSPRTLSRLFQTTMQVSFLQYLKMLRVVRAIELMLQTDKSISEIAYDVGYANISSFSKVFYQLTTIRPSDFAREVAGKLS